MKRIITIPAIVAVVMCIFSVRLAAQRPVDNRAVTISRMLHQEADTVQRGAADDLMHKLPEPYYRDSLPFLLPGLLIYSDVPDMEEEVLRFDTVPVFRQPAPSLIPDSLTNPRWLSEALIRYKSSRALQQILMSRSHRIDYFAWELPEPPELAPITEAPVLPAMRTIPNALPSFNDTPAITTVRRHWLHIMDFGVQFSQAYISPNWYQGGDNSLTVLANLRWNVKLNQVYHPNLLLESNLQYKLGMYSTPNDQYHKYAISEDLLQYNLTGGLKAVHNWYYSFSMLFKTQFLNNYASDSWDRKASFLSPGELNVGLGMTYSKEDKKRGIVFKASIAPLSYNLRTCLDRRVDPTQFNIKAGHKYRNEIGSNAELTMTWQLAPNISWRQRLYLFSDYTYFTGDWEHTFNFSINRFLSTQLYVHGRYDTSVSDKAKGWKKWMLKEILSFGFAYSFTTIPPKK